MTQSHAPKQKVHSLMQQQRPLENQKRSPEPQKCSLEQYEPLAAACKALAHPARLAILQHLAQRNSCICGDVVAIMPLSQATVSQHLKILKEAGLISGTIDGPRSCYCINAEAIAQLRATTDALFGNLQSCC